MTVRAAGGVLYRESDDGGVEVLLVHRLRYDDWSLPKGKCEEDESDEDCARREVAEETGLRGELGPELASTAYRDGRGRRKRVRYWAMQPLDGHFEPLGEVDEVRWLPLDEAEQALSWTRDVEVLRSLEKVLGVIVYLIRHASAGKRSEWRGDDRLRPLDERGRRQAEALVGLLDGRELDRILSSPYVRCMETVEPLARARGLEVELEEALAEGADPEAALELLRGAGDSVEACVHGDLVEALLGDVKPKGSTTGLELAEGPPAVLERLPPART